MLGLPGQFLKYKSHSTVTRELLTDVNNWTHYNLDREIQARLHYLGVGKDYYSVCQFGHNWNT